MAVQGEGVWTPTGLDGLLPLAAISGHLGSKQFSPQIHTFKGKYLNITSTSEIILELGIPLAVELDEGMKEKSGDHIKNSFSYI